MAKFRVYFNRGFGEVRKAREWLDSNGFTNTEIRKSHSFLGIDAPDQEFDIEIDCSLDEAWERVPAFDSLQISCLDNW